MKHLSILLLSMIISLLMYGQTNKRNCNCPKTKYADTTADTVFHLSNGKSIALCGSRETSQIKGRTLFREFILSTCGSNKIINFWQATEVCEVSVIKDALFVKGLVYLPVGKHFKYRPAVWTIERIWYVRGKDVRKVSVNRRFPKYDKVQIRSVIKLYEEAQGGINDHTMEIADKLFVCAVSGSQLARKDLLNFKKKFKGIDGAYAEQYDDLTAMLQLWDSKPYTVSN